MKTYLKTLVKMFTNHVTRFISIIFIVFVSVGFCSGIGLAADKISYSLSDYYKSANSSDFIIKSADGGFSEEQIAEVRTIFAGADVQQLNSVDLAYEQGGETCYARLYFIDFSDWRINKPQLTQGAMPENSLSALCERADNKLSEVPVGTEITIDFKDVLTRLAIQSGQPKPNLALIPSVLTTRTVKISGVVQSPLTFGQDGEPSYLTPPDVEIPDTTDGINSLETLLSYILYLPADIIPELNGAPVLSPRGDLWVASADRNVFGDFSPAYSRFIKNGKAAITSSAVLDGAQVITMYENYSFSALHAYGEKVLAIGYILTAAFLFVTALVVLSTMTRLLEEERGQIACLSTLGYGPAKIIFKYLLFAAIATGIGGVGAYFIGIGISRLIYYVFNFSFSMPRVSPHIAVVFFLIIFAIIVAATLFATFIAGRKTTAEKPAELLRPKPPRSGKKVFLERIPAIWNRIPFRFKSTVRNVLRYKSRFIMTVVAVAVATALVFAGFALLDLCLFHGINSPSIMGVAVLVVAFAGLLTAVVIYAITNINISERRRELATLMVLGYQGREVAGYIHREIYIDSLVGIIAGFPLAALIMLFLYNIMGTGSISSLTWFWWLVSPACVFAFAVIITLALIPKITKIDMNQSLKAIE